MSNFNNKMLFVEHPFKKGVQVNLYPLFEKMEDFVEDCGKSGSNGFTEIDKFLEGHIRTISINMLAAAKDEMTSYEINSMFFSLYKLKDIFQNIQEIKT